MVTTKELYEYYVNEVEPKYSRMRKKIDTDDYLNHTKVYLSNKKILVFVAGLHLGYVPQDKKGAYIRFQNSLFKKIKPSVVLLELPVTTSKKYFEKWLERPKSEWLEFDWAIHLAKKLNAEFKGMDLPHKLSLDVFLKFEGTRNAKLALFSNFLLNYYSAASFWKTNAKGIATGQDIYEFAKYKTLQSLALRAPIQESIMLLSLCATQ